MSEQQDTARAPLEIENPVSGERILVPDQVTGQPPLVWELFLAPGGRVPSSHAHPRQQERFTVLAGSMRFAVDGRRRTVTAGQRLTVEPGTVHAFANAGPRHRPRAGGDPARAGHGAAAGNRGGTGARTAGGGTVVPAAGRPRAVHAGFECEVRAPLLAVLVRAAMRAIAVLARWTGQDRR